MADAESDAALAYLPLALADITVATTELASANVSGISQFFGQSKLDRVFFSLSWWGACLSFLVLLHRAPDKNLQRL